MCRVSSCQQNYGSPPRYTALVLVDGSLEGDTSMVWHHVCGIECSGPSSTLCGSTPYGGDLMILVDGTGGADISFVC